MEAKKCDICGTYWAEDGNEQEGYFIEGWNYSTRAEEGEEEREIVIRDLCINCWQQIDSLIGEMRKNALRRKTS